MTTDTLAIPLHDNSQVVISRTDTGMISLELLAPMTLRDGHGLAVKGSALLTDESISALVGLFTTEAQRQEAA